MAAIFSEWGSTLGENCGSSRSRGVGGKLPAAELPLKRFFDISFWLAPLRMTAPATSTEGGTQRPVPAPGIAPPAAAGTGGADTGRRAREYTRRGLGSPAAVASAGGGSDVGAAAAAAGSAGSAARPATVRAVGAAPGGVPAAAVAPGLEEREWAREWDRECELTEGVSSVVACEASE